MDRHCRHIDRPRVLSVTGWSLLVSMLLAPAFVWFPADYVDGNNPWLSGTPAVVAWLVSLTGSVYGSSLVVLVLAGCYAWINGAGMGDKTRRFISLLMVLSIFVGGGAFLNEHVIKPAFHQPRPNIEQLGRIPPGAPLLSVSAGAFYALPENGERGAALAMALQDWDSCCTPLHPLVRDHWIKETGYSFPSGHAFAATAIAFFFTLACSGASSRKRVLSYFLLSGWALLVCYSRLLLGVHAPIDVLAGMVGGILAGSAAYLVFCQARRNHEN